MAGKLIFACVALACTMLVFNQLYRLLKYQEINLKGVVYSRKATPIQYWMLVALSLVALPLMLLFFLGATMMLAAP